MSASASPGRNVLCAHMLRRAGIVALFVLAACGQSSGPKAAVSPSVPVQPANWTQDISFSGDLTGHMAAIVADVGNRTSVCTGARPRTGQLWADRFFGAINNDGSVYGVIFNVGNYAGPGTYKDGAVTVQVFDPADPTRVWENLGADSVTFVLDRSQESGMVDAKLTNADSGKGGALHITGSWHCKA